MLKKAILVLFLLHPVIGFGEQVPSIEEIELSNDNELEEFGFTDIDNLLKFDYESRREKFRLAPEKIIKSPWASEVFPATLKKNSIIRKIFTRQKLETSRAIYVYAKQIILGGLYSYLYSKKGKILYKTLTRNLVSIKKDLHLFYDIPGDETYPPPSEAFSTNKKFIIDAFFGVHYISRDSDYYSEVSSQALKTFNGTGASVKTFFIWNSPFHFGLHFNWVRGTSRASQSILTGNQYSLGPSLRFYFTKRTDSPAIFVDFEVSKTFYHKIQFENAAYDLSSLAGAIHVGAKIPYNWEPVLRIQ